MGFNGRFAQQQFSGPSCRFGSESTDSTHLRHVCLSINRVTESDRKDFALGRNP
jgi:hypothetical protein